MSFIDLARTRFSVRSYSSRPISREQILDVLEAGRIAPSACNNQPWFFIVIQDPANIQALKVVYGRDWFLDAPVIIAVCCDTTACWKRGDGKSYGDVDMAIAVDHMTLQATEMGLGTCWVGAFNAHEARTALNLPEHIEPVLFMSLGYTEATPGVKKRKKLDEVVFWEKFGK